MAAKKSRAKSRKSKPAGELIPQPHGGALRRGYDRSPGRPSSEIRRRMRGTFEDRYEVLTDMLEKESKASDGDKLRALDLLLKYGLGSATKLSVDAVRDRLAETLRVIREEVPDDADRIVDRLEAVRKR